MVRLQSRVFWLLVLIGHGVAAAGWGWLMPRGFPLSHPQFWVNQALPVIVGLTVLAILIAAYRGRLVPAKLFLLTMATAYLAAAVSCRIRFPVSFNWRWVIFVGAGAVAALAALAPKLRDARPHRLPTAIAAVAGLVLGTLLPWSQRAGPPATRPMNESLQLALDPATDPIPRQHLHGMDVEPRSGLITLQHGPYVCYVQPLLSFRSLSPDRCWTVFAPRDLRTVSRTLTGFRSREGGVLMSYEDLGRSELIVEGSGEGAAVIWATTSLPEPAFSHLNTYCEFHFTGHRELSVAFSPCPDQRIAVTYSEYPVGDPTRFAYLDAGGRFRVVEASSAEKGPFKMLAGGSLSRGDALTMTLFDQDKLVTTLTLRNFAAQASVELSPTAGWGVPQNAIEFSRDTRDPRSTASFFVTLAGTSVGRGWSSVGHAAGTYRNQMRVQFEE